MQRGLLADDAEESEIALDGLHGAVHHQGDIYDCTVACFPFLLEAVIDPSVQDRGASGPATAAVSRSVRAATPSPFDELR